ncbi:hypothetical protein LOD99_2017 [Oopsacas minuta]|uniref:Uncharacterized protein n=1 Tax=Oopsacas minuta TaxID=111878 RepID=A0AAV7K2U5_9METZ|nr:hypothetical protein LOD99_2017 [Oopsacas minuta]
MASKSLKVNISKHPYYPTVLTNFESDWQVVTGDSIAQFGNLLSRYLLEIKSILKGMSESDKIIKPVKPYIIGLNELIRCLEKDELEFVIVTNAIPEVMRFHLSQLFHKNETIFLVFEALNTLNELFNVKRLSCIGIKRNQLKFGIGKNMIEEIRVLFQMYNLSKSDYSIVKGKKRKSQEVHIYKYSKIKVK